jgi:ribokinase
MSEPFPDRGPILVVGDIVTDILAVHSGPLAVDSDTQARISVSGGGSAANTAAWIAGTGTPVELVGVVGRDIAGNDRLTELVGSGVSCVHVRQSGDAATGSVIVLARSDLRSMLCDRGANLLLVPSDVDAALAGGTRASHLHLSGYTLLDGASRPAGTHALTAAAASGLTTSVDAASAAPLRRAGGATFLSWVDGTDLLLANLAEARALLDDPTAPATELARALTGYARQVVVKLGDAGAVWAGADGSAASVEAVAATGVVDPTGAGDAFAAGLLTAWLGGATPVDCLRAGAILGARAVASIGGRPVPD